MSKRSSNLVSSYGSKNPMYILATIYLIRPNSQYFLCCVSLTSKIGSSRFRQPSYDTLALGFLTRDASSMTVSALSGIRSILF